MNTINNERYNPLYTNEKPERNSEDILNNFDNRSSRRIFGNGRKNREYILTLRKNYKRKNLGNNSYLIENQVSTKKYRSNFKKDNILLEKYGY